mgnify:CR=1 FL=1
MLRLVLDTNVWLDWLVFDDPGISTLRALSAADKAEIIINAECEAELIRVLAYSLQQWTLDAHRQSACLAECRAVAQSMDTSCDITLPDCADPDDQKFLVLAAGCGAAYLLSKDRALLALQGRRPPLPFHIVTPAEFTRQLGVK